MSLALRFHEEARAELERTATLLEQERPGWGVRFASEAEQALTLVCDTPAIGAAIDRTGRRRMLLDSFPYSIVYRVDAAGVLVLAVAHQKRRPGYFRARG